MIHPSPYTTDDRERWRRQLLAKGGEIAAMLEELLSKKEVDLQKLELRLVDDEKEPKEKRLRRYFDFVMKRLRAVGDERFGYDKNQGRFLAVRDLDEVPWADVEP